MAHERTDLMQGTLELLILNTLARESMHGYGIVQRIHEAAEDLLKNASNQVELEHAQAMVDRQAVRLQVAGLKRRHARR